MPTFRRLLWVTWVAWVVHELAAVPAGGARGADASDEGTIRLNTAMFILANAGAPALALAQQRPPLGRRWQWCALGAAWMGLGLRRWSIVTLGRWFRRDVAIRDEQPVIDHGPYRRVRHPAYTGALLVQAGLGASTGLASAFAASTLPATIGYVRRVVVEDRFLTERLPGYATYRASHPWRLVPYVW